MLGDSGAGWWCPSIGGQGYGEAEDDNSLGGTSQGSHSFFEGLGFGQGLQLVMAESGMQGLGRSNNGFQAPSKVTPPLILILPMFHPSYTHLYLYPLVRTPLRFPSRLYLPFSLTYLSPLIS